MRRVCQVLFLMVLMLCLQYARQVAFLECTLTNLTAEVTCDCEVETSQSTQPGELPGNKHNHVTVDDFFFVAPNHTGFIANDVQHRLISPTQFLKSQMLSGIFRPPKVLA